MDWHDFPPGDEPEVLTGISPECHRGECGKCAGFRRDEPLMFCVHECHRVDPAELVPSTDDKWALPIVPHEFVGGVDCCGCLIVGEREGQADLTCNECGAVVSTVPRHEVDMAA
jgi:hypothetical protein